MIFTAEQYAELAARIEQRVADARKANSQAVAAVHYHAENDETPIVLHALRLATHIDRLWVDNDRWIARLKELEARLEEIRRIVR